MNVKDNKDSLFIMSLLRREEHKIMLLFESRQTLVAYVGRLVKQ